MANQMSRRDMLKMSIVGAGALALSGVNASAATNEKDVKFDEEYDVIIVGTGFAGLAAAIKASERGKKVLILEKMGRAGGNSVINGGNMAAPMSKYQAAQGIKDSKEIFIADAVKDGLGLNHTELLGTMFDRSNDAVALLEKCGAEFSDKLLFESGHSVARSLQATNGSGSGYIQPMLNKLKDDPNVTLKTRAKFDDFVLNDSGRVVGVIGRENYKFDAKLFSDDLENTSGDTKTYKAKSGVLLAAGGFGRDLWYRQVQDPRVVPTIDSTNQQGSTAGALLKATDLGAVTLQTSWIQFLPYCSPDEKGFGAAVNFTNHCCNTYGITVNPKTGKRFMNEHAGRKIKSDACFSVIGKDENYPINLCDQQAVDARNPIYTSRPLEIGVIWKFDTLDALAAHFKIPAAALKESVKKYNDGVAAGKDEFGKPVDKLDGINITKPPFYASRTMPKVHHTCGGLEINTKAQVISYKTHKPIEGLYAAGEIAGGVHGASRLGTYAILDCMVFGMIAGENI
ncbi:MAG: flavocytochrome c [Campylobacter sp.]|nr:flavocytochrome c [Campylobacter sp.]